MWMCLLIRIFVVRMCPRGGTFLDTLRLSHCALRKNAYSNVLIISPLKTESFRVKNLIVFIFLLKSYNMGTRKNRLAKAVLTSIHNLFFWAEIRKNNVYPVNPSFTIFEWDLRGSKLYMYVFVMKCIMYTQSLLFIFFYLENQCRKRSSYTFSIFRRWQYTPDATITVTFQTSTEANLTARLSAFS